MQAFDLPLPTTSAAALQIGSIWYFTGKPCTKGHISRRFVTSRGCETCASEYRQKDPKARSRASIRSRQKKRLKYNQYSYEWRKKNPEKVHSTENRRYANNVQFRLKKCLRARLSKAIRNNVKIGSAIKDLGCSVSKLQMHLESAFHSGMSWQNHGALWQIDHRIALSKFDLTNAREVAIACHYTNLQPLLIEDHKAKTKRDLR